MRSGKLIHLLVYSTLYTKEGMQKSRDKPNMWQLTKTLVLSPSQRDALSMLNWRRLPSKNEARLDEDAQKLSVLMHLPGHACWPYSRASFPLSYPSTWKPMYCDIFNLAHVASLVHTLVSSTCDVDAPACLNYYPLRYQVPISFTDMKHCLQYETALPPCIVRAQILSSSLLLPVLYFNVSSTASFEILP